MAWFRRLILAVLLTTGAMCGPAKAESVHRSVTITSNGWHTGITIARADLAPGMLPETADFPGARYFEFGWGDREYYPAPRKDLGMTLGAALPGPAIIHMIGLDRDAMPPPAGVERVRILLAEDQFRKLVAYLDSAFERRGASRVQPSSPGLYPFSKFYPATGSFHLFNTCNTWVARGLALAGLPIRVSGVQRAEDLMSQVRALAHPRSQ